MQRQRSTLLMLGIWLLTIAVYAQNNVPVLEARPKKTQTTERSTPQPSPFYRAGIHLGLLSGYGFSGGITFPVRLSLQGSFFLMKFGDNFFYSFGTELQYHFSNPRTHNLYILLGSGYYYNSTNGANTLNNPVRVGLGFGYHYYLTQQWMADIQLNITWFTGHNSSILPLPQLGFFYVFE